MSEQYGEAGHYDQTEGFTCDECGCAIGDYVKYDDVKRCVGCWIEFEMNVLYGASDLRKKKQQEDEHQQIKNRQRSIKIKKSEEFINEIEQVIKNYKEGGSRWPKR